MRSEQSTQFHALAVMLAYLVVRRLQDASKFFDLTAEEGLRQLAQLFSIHLQVDCRTHCHQIPAPRSLSANLLKAPQVTLPKVLSHLEAVEVTRRKPTERRRNL